MATKDLTYPNEVLEPLYHPARPFISHADCAYPLKAQTDDPQNVPPHLWSLTFDFFPASSAARNPGVAQTLHRSTHAVLSSYKLTRFLSPKGRDYLPSQYPRMITTFSPAPPETPPDAVHIYRVVVPFPYLFLLPRDRSRASSLERRPPKVPCGASSKLKRFPLFSTYLLTFP